MPFNSSHEGFGRTVSPFEATTETTLASLDPARDILLALFKAVLIHELGQRWTLAVQGTPLEGRAPVEWAVPDEPDPQLLRSEKTRLPTLFVYRSPAATRFDEFTLSEARRTREFLVDYIIGPLDVMDRRKALDALGLAEVQIERTVAAGGHRAYSEVTLASGRKHSRNVLTSQSYCGFSTARIATATCGVARFAEDSPRYYALSASLEVTELSTKRPCADATEFQGANLQLGTGNDQGIVPNLVEAKS